MTEVLNTSPSYNTHKVNVSGECVVLWELPSDNLR